MELAILSDMFIIKTTQIMGKNNIIMYASLVSGDRIFIIFLSFQRQIDF